MEEVKEVGETCAICLGDGVAEKIDASLSGCVHKFHFGCIKAWSEKENTCPLCKQRFSSVKVASSEVNGKAKTVRVKKKDQRPDETEFVDVGEDDDYSDDDYDGPFFFDSRLNTSSLKKKDFDLWEDGWEDFFDAGGYDDDDSFINDDSSDGDWGDRFEAPISPRRSESTATTSRSSRLRGGDSVAAAATRVL